MANKFFFVTILLVKCNLHQSLVKRSIMRFRVGARNDKKQPLPTLALPEQGRESSNTPSPDWGRSGWGVSRKGFYCPSEQRNVIQNPLQIPVLASLRPSSRSPLQVQKVLKLFSPLQSVQLCDSGSQPGMTKNQSLPTLTLPE